MIIAIDAMGGDNAPLEIVKGVIDASKIYNEEYVLIGDKGKIDDVLKEQNLSLPDNIKVVHTSTFVTMEDDPMVVMKEKSDSSITTGMNMLKNGEVDVFLSAGNTGALHVASSLIVRRIKGVRRSGIATVIPLKTPLLLMDSGANPEVTPDILLQWAIIGSFYAKHILGIDNPRVGLLNNGTEEHKGTPTVVEAHKLLKESDEINFVGNVEAKELTNSVCDVVVTDGFTGNVTLKMIEGMAKFFGNKLKEMFKENPKTIIAYLLMKKQIKQFKKSFDASEYGGAPFLGIDKPVIKAHGSSHAKDIESAIKQAIKYVKSDIICQVRQSLNK